VVDSRELQHRLARVTEALKTGVGALADAYAECVSEEPTVSTPGWAVMGPVLDRGIRLVKREVWAWRPGWLMAAVLGGAEERIEVEVDLYRRRGGAEMTKQSTPEDE
jgi:hypothetical protein